MIGGSQLPLIAFPQIEQSSQISVTQAKRKQNEEISNHRADDARGRKRKPEADSNKSRKKLKVSRDNEYTRSLSPPNQMIQKLNSIDDTLKERELSQGILAIYEAPITGQTNIKIWSQNINGKFNEKIPAISKQAIKENYDIVILQETKMRAGAEEENFLKYNAINKEFIIAVSNLSCCIES